MAWSLRRWRPRHLLLAWIGYWFTLALVTVGPAVPAVIRATRPDAKGSISAGMGDDGLYVNVIEGGITSWEGSVSLLALALWITVPPVLLWLAWLFRRPQRANEAGRPSAALPEPTPELFAPPRRDRERPREL